MKLWSIFLLMISLAFMGCQPDQVNEDYLNPPLKRIETKAPDDKELEAAYNFLVDKRNTILSMDVEKEIERLDSADQIKLRKRYADIKKSYNQAVEAYHEAAENKAELGPFETVKSALNTKVNYVIKQYEL